MKLALPREVSTSRQPAACRRLLTWMWRSGPWRGCMRRGTALGSSPGRRVALRGSSPVAGLRLATRLGDSAAHMLNSRQSLGARKLRYSFSESNRLCVQSQITPPTCTAFIAMTRWPTSSPNSAGPYQVRRGLRRLPVCLGQPPTPTGRNPNPTRAIYEITQEVSAAKQLCHPGKGMEVLYGGMMRAGGEGRGDGCGACRPVAP